MLGAAAVSAGASLLGSVFGGSSADKDRKYQKQFAQNQIQWRVADAKAAGVHPLYALGAPTISYSPVGDGGVGASMSQLGQDLSRAKMAQMDRRERQAALAREEIDRNITRQRESVLYEQQVRANELDMQYTQSQIARLNSAQLPPASPTINSSVPNPRVQPEPSRPVIGHSSNPAREPGTITDYRFVRTPNNRLAIAPSADWSGNVDDITNPQTLGWMWRNNVVPFFDRGHYPRPNPREYPLPPGATEWRWSGMDFYPYYPPSQQRRSRRPRY